MPKNTEIYECSHCTAQFTKWTGRCLECSKWGTVEKTEFSSVEKKNDAPQARPLETTNLINIKSSDQERVKTNISEMDTVLGGGLVRGSFILLGGEPGIGKSTLSLQLANSIEKTLYFSGEESLEQIKLRSDRLKNQSSTLRLANSTNLDSVIATIKIENPTLAIIDSIQTFSTDEADGSSGSITQVRACATKLMETAKSTGTSIVLIGHVTKDGGVAGPKTLEHIVDVVLYLEGDHHHDLRMLRAVKNRFGSTDEVGMFEMKETGLVGIKDVSAKLLYERGMDAPGSVITCLIEGSRPMLVEVQALVNKTVFGYPVRKASGFDLNRLHVLIAVLERRAGLNLSSSDVHLNIVGGVRADEPATDLAVCLAIASAYKDKSLGMDLAVFGEVGLSGEIRSVGKLDKRIKECQYMGIKRVITTTQKKSLYKDLKIIAVNNIKELIKYS